MNEIEQLGKMCGRSHLYSTYDHTHIVAHLEKQARDGWLLMEMNSSANWLYRAIEPQSLHFAIRYAPEAMMGGQDWHLAAKNKRMCVFYSTKDVPEPLAVDAMQEVKRMHTHFLRHLFVVAAPIIVFCLFYWRTLMQLWQAGSQEPALWMISLLLGSLLLYLASKWFTHHKWYKQALLIAESQGIILATPDTARRNKFWFAVMIALAIGTWLAAMWMWRG